MEIEATPLPIPGVRLQDRTLDSQVWTEKHGTIQDGQVRPAKPGLVVVLVFHDARIKDILR